VVQVPVHGSVGVEEVDGVEVYVEVTDEVDVVSPPVV